MRAPGTTSWTIPHPGPPIREGDCLRRARDAQGPPPFDTTRRSLSAGPLGLGIEGRRVTQGAAVCEAPTGG